MTTFCACFYPSLQCALSWISIFEMNFSCKFLMVHPETVSWKHERSLKSEAALMSFWKALFKAKNSWIETGQSMNYGSMRFGGLFERNSRFEISWLIKIIFQWNARKFLANFIVHLCIPLYSNGTDEISYRLPRNKPFHHLCRFPSSQITFHWRHKDKMTNELTEATRLSSKFRRNSVLLGT